MSRPARWKVFGMVAVSFVVSVSAVVGAGAPATKPAPVQFRPKARALSTYQSNARFEIGTKDVTFEVPEPYRDSFAFWAGRMKGQKRSESCEIMTNTEEAAEGGSVPFRRIIPKFDVEIRQMGQVMAPESGYQKTVAAMIWEGSLDPLGNVKDLRKVAGKDDPDVAVLAIPEMFIVFPEVEGPRDLELGTGFHEERIVRLPTKLNIAGLEKLTLKMTREYNLKAVTGDLATFDVKITYSDDPAFKPEAANTSCRISGGGSGEAVFDLKRGVFQTSRLPASMRLDIEAPLRPLPNQPPTDVPILGKSHIDLDLLLSSLQTVKRVWGDDPD